MLALLSFVHLALGNPDFLTAPSHHSHFTQWPIANLIWIITGPNLDDTRLHLIASSHSLFDLITLYHQLNTGLLPAEMVNSIVRILKVQDLTVHLCSLLTSLTVQILLDLRCIVEALGQWPVQLRYSESAAFTRERLLLRSQERRSVLRIHHLGQVVAAFAFGLGAPLALLEWYCSIILLLWQLCLPLGDLLQFDLRWSLDEKFLHIIQRYIWINLINFLEFYKYRISSIMVMIICIF